MFPLGIVRIRQSVSASEEFAETRRRANSVRDGRVCPI
jgi:hypothetical protein